MRQTDTKTKSQDLGQDAWSENPSLPTLERPTSATESDKKPDSTSRFKPKDEAFETVNRCLDDLNDALRQGKSETLVAHLSFLAKFHNYSINNSLLIAAQCPHATHVAGYDKWKQLGRQVRKGEKGIAILAPTTAKKTVDVEGQNGKTEKRDVRRITGFRVAKVFDVSQTEGKELPEAAKINGDPGEFHARLENIVAQNGIDLTYDYPGGGALGLSSGGQIMVRPDLEPAEKFAVLAHELAHEMLHKGSRRHETNVLVRETEAEAVAFVVCKAMGLDSTTRSSDYISLYRGDPDVLRESLQFIQKTSTNIIRELNKD